jgi:hypothetical protein
VNRIAYEQIEQGMSLAEVEEILGGTEGYYATEEVIPDIACGNELLPLKEELGLPRSLWWGNQILVIVSVNEYGRVKYKRAIEMRPMGPNVFDQIQTQLGL